MEKAKRRKLTPEEIAFIYNNYGKLTVTEIAERLGISKHTVCIRIKRARKRGILEKASPEQLLQLRRKGVEIRERKLRSEGKRTPYIPKEVLEELYIKEHLTQKEIARKFGLTQQIIAYQMRKYNIQTRDARFKPAEVNLQPSKELAYILGVLKGDGSVNQHGYTVRLEVISKDFAESFAKALKAIKLHPHIYRRKKLTRRSKNLLWVACANSKIFYEWYKNLTFEDVKKIAEMFPEDFIRGFYESEGCLSKGIDKRWYKLKGWVIERMDLRMANTDRAILELIKDLLAKFNIEAHLYKITPKNHPITKREYFVLAIYSKPQIKRFIELVQPVIKR